MLYFYRVVAAIWDSGLGSYWSSDDVMVVASNIYAIYMDGNKDKPFYSGVTENEIELFRALGADLIEDLP